MSNKLDAIYNWRYERKFTISELTLPTLISLVKLHPSIFSEIYHMRFVNSIYFDSILLKNYFDNVDGLSRRIKFRIRWYGDIFGFIEKPILELKIKNGLLGRKESFKLSPFSINKGFTIETIQKLIEDSNIPEEILNELKFLEPVLLNRYKRTYYESADKKYRITIDSDIASYKIGRHNNSFLSKSINRNTLILELKYDEKNELNVKEIVNKFPFRLSKNSKFVNGLELQNLW